jgi:hypothetical protein
VKMDWKKMMIVRHAYQSMQPGADVNWWQLTFDAIRWRPFSGTARRERRSSEGRKEITLLGILRIPRINRSVDFFLFNRLVPGYGTRVPVSFMWRSVKRHSKKNKGISSHSFFF